ncbi:hypothetical protein Agub_g7668, partial [Astrephomene gubernaculifera]
MGESEGLTYGPAAISERGARELLNQVIEFLQFIQFHQTVHTLVEERATKSVQLRTSLLSARTHSKDVRDRLRADMLRKFDEGRRDEFFALWHQYVPAHLLGEDLDTLKLEFHLQVYFAVYPVLPSSAVLVVAPGSAATAAPGGGHGGGCGTTSGTTPGSAHGGAGSRQQELAQRMKVFKRYLEGGRGAALALNPECLPYYALPYVAQPEQHPSFESLFHACPPPAPPAWVVQQRKRLKAFLASGAGAAGGTAAGKAAGSRAGGGVKHGGGGGGGDGNCTAAAAAGGGQVPLLYMLYEQHMRASGSGTTARCTLPGTATASVRQPPQRHQQLPPLKRGTGASTAVTTGGGRSRIPAPSAAVAAAAPPAAAAVAAACSTAGAAGEVELYGSEEGEEHTGGEEEEEEEVDEAEMEAALRSPYDCATTPATANRLHPSCNGHSTHETGDNSPHRVLDGCRHHPDHPASNGEDTNNSSRCSVALLSLRQLGLTESAVLRESVVLIEGTMGPYDDGRATAAAITAAAAAAAAADAEPLEAARDEAGGGIPPAEGVAAAGGVGVSCSGDDEGVCGPSCCGGSGGSGSLAAALLAPLDYCRLQRDLQGPDRLLAARLLQALRWRLLRSPRGGPRAAALASLVQADVLGWGAAGEGAAGGDVRAEQQQQQQLPLLLQLLVGGGGGGYGNSSLDISSNHGSTVARSGGGAPDGTDQRVEVDPRVTTELVRLLAVMSAYSAGRRYLLGLERRLGPTSPANHDSASSSSSPPAPAPGTQPSSSVTSSPLASPPRQCALPCASTASPAPSSSCCGEGAGGMSAGCGGGSRGGGGSSSTAGAPGNRETLVGALLGLLQRQTRGWLQPGSGGAPPAAASAAPGTSRSAAAAPSAAPPLPLLLPSGLLALRRLV